MGRGVLPSFAFPVNIVRLHVLRDELREDEPRLRLERDGKIGLGDYAPGAAVMAGKRIYEAVGLQKYPALEFPELRWFRLCNTCGHLDNLDWTDPRDCHPNVRCAPTRCSRWPHDCGSSRPGVMSPTVQPSPRSLGDCRPLRVQTTRSFFLGSRPAASDSSITAETVVLPNPSETLRVEGSYA